MEKIYLPSSGKELKIENCIKCHHKMVNTDLEDLKEVDTRLLNRIGLRWSNPKTEDLICVQCEIRKYFSFREEEEEEEEKSWDSPASIGSILGGFGGFSGFGGGSFGGAGSSR